MCLVAKIAKNINVTSISVTKGADSNTIDLRLTLFCTPMKTSQKKLFDFSLVKSAHTLQKIDL